MKKILFTIAALVILIPLASASAQMMYGNYNGNQAPGYMMQGYSQASTTPGTMSSEEAAGYAIAQKLQSKTLACADLSQDNYESLGEYYIGLMMGSSHESMDQYIEKTYSADYLRSMHIAMGERFSGCNVNVALPAGMMDFGPMMGGYGMMGNWGPPGIQGGQGNWQGRGYSMMGWGFPSMMGSYYGGYGWFGWVTMILVWVLLALGIAAAVKWLRKNK